MVTQCIQEFHPGSYEIVSLDSDLLGTPGYCTAIYVTSRDDGDVAEDFYLPDVFSHNNFVVITEVDTAANFVRGAFGITFSVQFPHTNHANPRTVTFSAGEFETKFRN